MKEKINFYDEKEEVVWGAFYTDSHHEVEEVTSGTRITLQYDLYAKEGK